MENELFTSLEEYESLLEHSKISHQGDYSIALSFFDLCDSDTVDKLVHKYHLTEDKFLLKMENSLLRMENNLFVIYDRSGYVYRFLWNGYHWKLVDGPLE